jgi:hypothetical protein
METGETEQTSAVRGESINKRRLLEKLMEKYKCNA